MFNCQKTSAHQLPVKIQCQPLASHFVLNDLLGEFFNIDSIYKSYQPTIQSAVQFLKTESEFKNLSSPEKPLQVGPTSAGFFGSMKICPA